MLTTAHADAPPPKMKKRAAGRKVFKETRHPVYRGVRRKNAGKWVCEVRDKKSRIWLGTFPDPEAAALAHDVAALTLRGEDAQLNFPGSAGWLPRAQSSSHRDIRRAALEAARVFRSSSSSSSSSGLDHQKNNFETGNYHHRHLELVRPVLDESDNNNNNNNNNNNCIDGGVMGLIVDEEEVFNMPVLLDSMAEGMLLTPLAMKKGFNWDDELDDDDDRKRDFTLWIH